MSLLLSGCGTQVAPDIQATAETARPTSLRRGEQASLVCAVYALGGRYTVKRFTGKVEVEIIAGPGLTAVPARLEMNVQPGEYHHRTVRPFILHVADDAPQGEVTVSLKATKPDGTINSRDLQFEVRDRDN